MRVLALNAGSSSLRYSLFEMRRENEEDSRLIAENTIESVTVGQEVLRTAFEEILRLTPSEPVAAVGHRIVHGGDFETSLTIDHQVEKAIESLAALAPLHNSQGIDAWRAASRHFPDAIHVAVFDNAFHRTIPDYVRNYALPPERLENGRLRRYGFHGISCQSVALRFANVHGKAAEDFRLIVCHLGGGCSVTAIDHGQSIDNSMGFTPLEGLMMGTRSGDIDASAVLEIVGGGCSPHSLLEELNRSGGLRGVSGISSDMREVLKAADSGNSRARLAVEMFCYRAKKYIGAYLAALNGTDALIFAGGIGENSPAIRTGICRNLDRLGIEIDPVRNEQVSAGPQQIGSSPVPVWVIPSEEDLMIAREAFHVAATD